MAKVDADGKKRRTRKRKETYNIYIFKCLKTTNPELGMSSKAMAALNSFVNDMFDSIAMEAGKLVGKGKGQTLNHRTMKAAVSLALPNELATHACAEAEKAVQKYEGSS